MSEHTPGPWAFVPEKGAPPYEDETHYSVNAHHDEHSRPVATVNGDNAVWLGPGEDIANARLIAACPDLLAVLKGCVADHDAEVAWRRTGIMADGLHPYGSDLYDAARAIVAKAEVATSTEAVPGL